MTPHRSPGPQQSAVSSVFGQAQGINSSLPTTSLGRSTRTVRMSSARLPSHTGLSPSSRRR